MIYFDSNYLIKCYVAEPGSAEVLRLAQSESGRACAVHGRLEFWSGIKRHVREGNLTSHAAQKVFRQFTLDESAGLWMFLPASLDLIQVACNRLAALPDQIVCRAADALHLACAATEGFSAIYSHDKHVLIAAPFFGIEGRDVIR